MREPALCEQIADLKREIDFLEEQLGELLKQKRFERENGCEGVCTECEEQDYCRKRPEVAKESYEKLKKEYKKAAAVSYLSDVTCFIYDSSLEELKELMNRRVVSDPYCEDYCD